MISDILIRRNYLPYVSCSVSNKPNRTLAATVQAELQKLGFTLSADDLETISFANPVYLTGWLSRVTETLRKHIGINKYEPMYKGFPDEVMEKSDAELYLNAFVHYFTAALKDAEVIDTTWLPATIKKNYPALKINKELKVLKLAQDQSVVLSKIANDLLNSNTSLSPVQKEELIFLFREGFISSLDGAKYKENKALVLGEFVNKPQILDFTKHCKTATDVLRVMVVYSGGEVALTNKVHFKSIPRQTRRNVLSFLNKLDKYNFEYDVRKHSSLWKGLFGKLHPREYKNEWGKVARIANKLYKTELLSKNTNIEHAIKFGNVKYASQLLTAYPGDFARRFMHLVRLAKTKTERDVVLQSFLEVCQKVSAPVIIQLVQALLNSGYERVVIPKGNVANAEVLPPVLYTEEQINFFINCACQINFNYSQKYKTLPEMGKVYIDDSLFTIPAIFANRNATEGMKLIPRGSYFNLEGDGNIVRFFIWWKNIDKDWTGRVDLDLSAKLFDENFENNVDVAYYSLKGFGGTHSGDITDAPRGASEYIDIDINKLVKSGYRYVVMCVNSYTGQTFDQIPNVAAGWMVRDGKTGKHYEPSTVENRVKVNSKARFVCPLIIDVVNRKVFWIDSSIKQSYAGSNAHSKHSDIQKLGKAFISRGFVSVGHILYNHCVVRKGSTTSNKDEADIVFDKDFNLEKFVSEYLI